MGLIMTIMAWATMGVSGDRMVMSSGITIMAYLVMIAILAGEDSPAAALRVEPMGDFTAGADSATAAAAMEAAAAMADDGPNTEIL
jgi:hypothetical protein